MDVRLRWTKDDAKSLSCFSNAISIKNIERKAFRGKASAEGLNWLANSFCVPQCNAQVNFRKWKALRFFQARTSTEYVSFVRSTRPKGIIGLQTVYSTSERRVYSLEAQLQNAAVTSEPCPCFKSRTWLKKQQNALFIVNSVS